MSDSPATEPPQPVTLSLWTEDGQQHDTVLPGPGGTVRFCVGDPDGDRSASWRVWAPQNKSDVYLAVRDLAGEQKFSLHESGDWRQQFVSGDRAKAHGRDSRIIDQWQQPDELGDSRLTLGFSIRVRSQDLAPYSGRGRPPKDLMWLPASPKGKATVVEILIGRLQDLPVRFHGMIPFAAFSLADGRAVMVTVKVEDVPPEVDAQLDDVIATVSEQVDFSVAKAPRMVVHGNNEHGRLAWDIALKPPATG